MPFFFPGPLIFPRRFSEARFLNFRRKGLITNKCGTCGAAALPYVGGDSNRKVASPQVVNTSSAKSRGGDISQGAGGVLSINPQSGR